jgi:hypothetical protein
MENSDIKTEPKPVVTPPPREQPAASSLITQLLVNIVIPTLILVYLKKDSFLGGLFEGWIDDSKSFNKLALLIALAFPIVYGCLDFFDRHKINFFSIIGTVSVALTGGMGVMEIDPKYIAIKEAAVPGILGILTLVSLKTRYPFVRTLVFNPQIMQVDRIEKALLDNQATREFEKSLTKSTFILAGSFLLSATTNYFLAIFLLKSQPGTDAFNDEMAKMIAWSYPVNSLPAIIVMGFALYYTYRSIVKYTKLSLEEILHVPEDNTDQSTEKT